MLHTFDYSVPYDIMVGTWSGHSILYGAKGNYLLTSPSLVYIYWKKPGKVLHYRQDEVGNLARLVTDGSHEEALKDPVYHHSFDLAIDEKSCRSTGEDEIRVEGVESRPGTYLFHLTFPSGHYYNNQYFLNPNERHIIGPFVPNELHQQENDTRAFGGVIAQTFTRIEYGVAEDKREA